MATPLYQRNRWLLFKRTQNKISALPHSSFWQDEDFVSQRWVSLQQPLVLCESRTEAVPPLPIGHINLRPWRRQKYAPMIAVRSVKRRENRRSGHVVGRRGGRSQR